MFLKSPQVVHKSYLERVDPFTADFLWIYFTKLLGKIIYKISTYLSSFVESITGHRHEECIFS